MTTYIHGYTAREIQRLREQSLILEDLIHGGIGFPAGSRVLEPGCGVGAQTAALCRRNNGIMLTSADISQSYLDRAMAHAQNEGLKNVDFRKTDLLNLPFSDNGFDHVFICFVLEHIPDPHRALAEVKRVLKPGGGLVVVEGDHGSCFWHPETPESLQTWRSMVKAQQDLGHDPLIGRKLHPLLTRAGFQVDEVAPRWVYADATNRKLREGVVNRIIVPMTESAREDALETGLIDETTWTRGIAHLTGIPEVPGGTFFYTWFRGIAHS